MDFKSLLLYFVLGGLIVAATTYFGSRGQSIWAAFIALLPGITVITFITIYLQSGASAVTSYAKGMLILLPSWVLYIVGLIFLVPRIGIIYGLIASVVIYVATALLIIKLT
jgi:hypothetical protein